MLRSRPTTQLARRKFTDEMANEARQRFADGEYIRAIARSMGLAPLMVEAAIRGRDFYASQTHLNRFRDWPPVERTPEMEVKALRVAHEAMGAAFRNWNAKHPNGPPRKGETSLEWRKDQMRRIMQEKTRDDGPPANIHAILAAAAEAEREALHTVTRAQHETRERRAALASNLDALEPLPGAMASGEPLQKKNPKIERLIARMRKTAAIVR